MRCQQERCGKGRKERRRGRGEGWAGEEGRGRIVEAASSRGRVEVVERGDRKGMRRVVDRWGGRVSVRTMVDRVTVNVVVNMVDVRSRTVMVASGAAVGRGAGRNTGRVGRGLGAFEPVVEILAGTHLEDEEEPLRSLERLVESDDVWMLGKGLMDCCLDETEELR
jgi:hypothetical protein